LCQFAALALPLAPDVEGVAELGENPGTMMICHRLMRTGGHFHLLKLSCCG
jgi:hypothetical protein